MTDAELLKITFARLQWSYRDAGQILNIPRGTLAQYTTGRATIPPRVWLAVLEHEARIYQRQKDITDRANATRPPNLPQMETEQKPPRKLCRSVKD